MFEHVAQAWNTGLSIWERETLCTLAQQPAINAAKRFEDLTAQEVNSILFAFRRAVALGASCSSALLQDAVSQGVRC